MDFDSAASAAHASSKSSEDEATPAMLLSDRTRLNTNFGNRHLGKMTSVGVTPWSVRGNGHIERYSQRRNPWGGRPSPRASVVTESIE